MSRLFYNGAKVHHRLAHVQGGGLVFSVDNGVSRIFLRFEDIEEFEPWYLGLDPRRRTLSEVVVSDMRKLMLDIDSPDSTTLGRLLMYDFERHVTSRIHEVFFALGIGVPDTVFYSMCRDDKVSYHVVVPNFMFPAQTCAGLCMIISSNQAWDSCVDTGVYKGVQFIRIEGSTKFGEDRWKKRITQPGPLRQGLLSDPEGAHRSDLVIAISCSRRPCELNCGTWNICEQFRTGEQSRHGIIPLRRVKPGICIQCNRVHYRENAFIKRYMGRPTFVCWRYLATGGHTVL